MIVKSRAVTNYTTKLLYNTVNRHVNRQSRLIFRSFWINLLQRTGLIPLDTENGLIIRPGFLERPFEVETRPQLKMKPVRRLNV